MEVRGKRAPGHHFSLAIVSGKHRENLGQIMRLALNFGAKAIYLVDCKYTRQAADTMNTARSIPVIECDDIPEVVGARHVYLEISENATPLPDYKHPKSAVYIIGPENSSSVIPDDVDCVEIDSIASLNQAQAVAILLYDRQTKIARKKPNMEIPK